MDAAAEIRVFVPEFGKLENKYLNFSSIVGPKSAKNIVELDDEEAMQSGILHR